MVAVAGSNPTSLLPDGTGRGDEKRSYGCESDLISRWDASARAETGPPDRSPSRIARPEHPFVPRFRIGVGRLVERVYRVATPRGVEGVQVRVE